MLSLTQPTTLAVNASGPYLGESSVLGRSPLMAETTMLLAASADFLSNSCKSLSYPTIDRLTSLASAAICSRHVDEDAVGRVQVEMRTFV